jgi:hypothetical protein
MRVVFSTVFTNNTCHSSSETAKCSGKNGSALRKPQVKSFVRAKRFTPECVISLDLAGSEIEKFTSPQYIVRCR